MLGAEGAVRGSQDSRNSNDNVFARIKLGEYLAPMDPSQNRVHFFLQKPVGQQYVPEERTR